MSTQKGVRFTQNQPFGTSMQKQQPTASSMKTQQTKTVAKNDDNEYDDDFEDFGDKPSPHLANKTKSTTSRTANINNRVGNNNNQQTNSVQQASAKSQISDGSKQRIIDFEDIQATNNTNRYIIYKFMKKGFTSLTAEDLACTMVNPDFTIDFRKNTNEEWATQYQYKVVERLNKCKFNLQWVTRKQTDDQFEPFFQMIKDDDLSRVVEYFRVANCQPNEILDSVEKTSKKSPLHIAAAEGHQSMVEYLINKGARIDARDKLLRTPLHLACQSGHATVVKVLLDNNADPYEKDQSGRTAMHYATCSTCVEQIVILCEHGPDLVHMKDHAGRTALHYVVFNSMTRQVEMGLKLLNFGADVNALDNERRTPLHHAAEAGKARMIPLLVQRGASTGTKDTLKGKTPLELACSDHIKELIIVHSSPTYVPKQQDLAQGLSVEGNQMKIEPEAYDIFGMKSNSNTNRSPKKPINKPAINKKVRVEEQKYVEEDYYEGSVQYFKNPLGPPKEWEKVQDKFLPYNMKNYQERLVMFLKRVQEFGVQSYQHVKKPYLFTGSWMEYVRNMDDLMLQINGTRPNEAVMKVFNIFFPYDKPLPHGRGDELSLQDFYKGLSGQVNENRDCDPDVLKKNMENEADDELQKALKNNQVEEIQDLLDVKRQLMALEQINSMHQITIQEKDEKIRQLQDQLRNQADSQVNKQVDLRNEEQYLALLAENGDLKIQISTLTEYLNMSQSKLEEFTKLLESDDQRKRKEMEDMKSLSKLQELEISKNDLERQLLQERERNRALRFKAGQIFLTTLEKGGTMLNAANPAKNKKGDGDYYLEDDDALMRLLQRIQVLGYNLQQKLIEAGEPDGSGMITQTQFVNFLTKIGMTPNDILSIQRIVGFYEGGQPVHKLKITDIMMRIYERSKKRGQIEQETLQTLANEFRSKGYGIQEAFQHLDDNRSGTITFAELQDAFKAMKIEVSIQIQRNVLKLFDKDGDNMISLEEFEKQMSKYLDTGKAFVPQDIKDIQSTKISDQMKKELVEEMKQEVKQKVNYDDYGFKPFEIDEYKKKEQLIIEALKNGKLPVENISGEIKVQFDEGLNLISVPGKGIPIIGLNLVSYTQDGQKVEQQLYSTPCVNFRAKNNFQAAVTIPMINKDKNKISDFITISCLMQETETEATPDRAVFVGECFLPWKEVLPRNGEWLQQRIALADPSGKCPSKVQGMIKIFAKWIPAGSEKSKFNEDGSKREVVAPVSVPNKREQQVGANGTLEIFLYDYIHPDLSINMPKEKYYIEMSLGGPQKTNRSLQVEVTDDIIKEPPVPKELRYLLFSDVKTIAVADVNKDRILTLKIIAVSSKKVIAQSMIDISQTAVQKPNLKIRKGNLPMTIEGNAATGVLDMALKFKDLSAQPVGAPANKPVVNQQSILPAQIQQQQTQVKQKVEEVKQVLPQQIIQKQPTQIEQQQPKIEKEETFQEIKIGGTQALPENDDQFDDDDFEEE
ncbi:ankyrin repeat [Stylonychia lemnae]|uniref:Ankyrin repeat n=1 Tax=Stylonychia lemnae TaxID=5949 RepID=A0A078AS52_STYLE|nr:ankyrin repeat [Stylonychia lemnae]|eukprot:CDW84796.1 ankyrin repeat [Stylonychia lemnae]